MPVNTTAFLGSHRLQSRRALMKMVLGDATHRWSIADPTTRPMFPQSHACETGSLITLAGMCAAQDRESDRLWSRRALGCGLQFAAVPACNLHAVATTDTREMSGHVCAA